MKKFLAKYFITFLYDTISVSLSPSMILYKKSPAVTLLLGASLLWGTSFILIKQGLIAFGAAELATLRVTFACLFSLPFSLVRIQELKRDQLWKYLFSGAIGILFPAFLFALAQTRVNSSLTGMLNSLSPICTLIVGTLVFRQRFPKLATIGVMISFIGCIILALARANGVIVGINYYAIFIVGACTLYAFNINFVKFNLPDVNSVTLTSVSLLLVGPVAILTLFTFTDFVPIMQTHPSAWWSLLMIATLALFGTVIAHFLFYRMLRISSPLFASSVTYIMPIVAICWGMLDGELITSGHILGIAFLLAGVYLTTRSK